MRAADPPLGCGWLLGAPGQGQCFPGLLDDGMRALQDWDGVSVWFCPLLRAGGLPRGKAPGASKISTRALGNWPSFSAFYPLPPQPVDCSGAFWMLMPDPPAHFKFCKEFPCLFPLLKEQGYQRGLVRGGSVCPESEFCDFQALPFQYLPAWRHSLGRCTGPLWSSWLCLGGSCSNCLDIPSVWVLPGAAPPCVQRENSCRSQPSSDFLFSILQDNAR